MSPASFTPEQDLYFVLCDFGRSGQAYVETDPTQADASTIVRNLLETGSTIDLFGSWRSMWRKVGCETCRRSSPPRCETWRRAMDKR
jgi:hypothetical protein